LLALFALHAQPDLHNPDTGFTMQWSPGTLQPEGRRDPKFYGNTAPRGAG